LGIQPYVLAGSTNGSFTEALYYRQTPRGLKCLLCPKECTVHSEKDGYCMVRVANNNKLVTLNYAKPCYVNAVSPESLSLFHYIPGTDVLVVGAAGCNLTCLNCPVSHVSQKNPEEVTTQNLTPEQVINQCKQKGIKTLVFGYSEPVVFYEYMLSMAQLSKKNSIRTAMVSSGYISEEPMRELCKYLDAAVIDLKAFSDAGYQKLSGGSIYPPFKTMKIIREANIWLELTHKIIPGYTDNFNLIKDMIKWMVDNGYQSVPIHFNTFKPVYKLSQTKTTPAEYIQKAMDMAKSAGLNYVYTDNKEIKSGGITYCPECRKILIDRSGKKPKMSNFSGSLCASCKTIVNGIW
jgi:pyruvate formate lyase activating enzyme